MEYKKRIADGLLDLKMEAFGATLIVGPKGCGKTTTAKQKAKSVVEFQNEDNREKYLSVADNVPSKLLIGEKPRLFDEWQDAPKIWGAIRKSVDDEQKNDYTAVDGVVKQMKLTTVEQETLSHLMVGLTCIEIAKLCNANRTTIWRRRMRLQRKYALAINSL